MLSALKPANRPGLAVQGEARRRPSRIDFVSRSSGDRKTEALQATPRERQLSRVVGTLLSLRLRSNSFERRSTSLRTSQVRLASRTLSKGVRHFSDSRGAFNALPADDWASKTARPFFFFFFFRLAVGANSALRPAEGGQADAASIGVVERRSSPSLRASAYCRPSHVRWTTVLLTPDFPQSTRPRRIYRRGSF